MSTPRRSPTSDRNAQQQGYVAVHQASQQRRSPTVRRSALTIDPRDVFVFDPAGRTIRFPDRPLAAALTSADHRERGQSIQCVTDRSISTSTPPSGFPASARASTRRSFARTFAEANVDSVTIFAKCHHGWSYHPTKVGKQHPHLDFDLTRAQLDALHAAGINAPIYVSAGWDELAARENPGWRVVYAGRRARPPARRAARAGLGVPRLQLSLSRLSLPPGRRGRSSSSPTATASSSTSASRW